MSGQVVNLRELLDDPASARFQRLLILLLCCFMCVEGYDMQVLGYAAPAMIKALHTSKSGLGVVFGGAMFGFMIGAFVIGNLGDTVGRKKAIIGGLVVFGLFTLGTSFATTIPELLITRTLAGIGLGGAVPNAVALMAEYAPSKRRTFSVAVLYIGYTIGSATGGVIAARMIPVEGWPSVFILGGVMPLLVALLLLGTLPESVRFLALRGKRPEQVLGLLRRIRPDLSFPAGTTIAAEEEVRPGIPAKHLFTEGRALISILLWVGAIGNMMTHHFMTSWLPTALNSGGLPLSTSIIATAVMQALGAFGSLFIGYAVDRVGVMALAGLLILGVPCVIGLGHLNGSEALLLGLVGGTGFFLIGGQTGLNAVAGTIYPTYMRSTGTGWTNAMGRLGAMFGPMLGGVILSLSLPLSTVFLLSAVPVLISACALFALAQVQKSRGQPRPRGGPTREMPRAQPRLLDSSPVP